MAPLQVTSTSTYALPFSDKIVSFHRGSPWFDCTHVLIYSGPFVFSLLPCQYVGVGDLLRCLFHWPPLLVVCSVVMQYQSLTPLL